MGKYEPNNGYLRAYGVTTPKAYSAVYRNTDDPVHLVFLLKEGDVVTFTRKRSMRDPILSEWVFSPVE